MDKFYLFGHILGKIGFDGLERKNLCQNPCKCTGHQNVFSTLEEPRFLSIKWHQDEKSGMGKPKEMHKKFVSDNKFSSAEKNGDLCGPSFFSVQYIPYLKESQL